MERTIRDWQYVDRLTGMYEEKGIKLNREPYGPLTGTLVPPCISNSVAIIEALLAAAQGVKNISVGYGQCGNILQDVAAILALGVMAEETVERWGHKDVNITTVLHQWMGGFPADESKAFGVISIGSLIASLSKATKVIVKTPHEAVGIPTMEANAQGLKCTKQVVNMMIEQKYLGSALDQEAMRVKDETRNILDAVYEAGNGDIAQGAVNAVEAGILDIPFAPCRQNANLMLPCRDNDGAVRILEFGNLPFTKRQKEFHREKIAERAEVEKREPSFQMVTDDVYSIGKGLLVGRPRHNMR